MRFAVALSSANVSCLHTHPDCLCPTSLSAPSPTVARLPAHSIQAPFRSLPLTSTFQHTHHHHHLHFPQHPHDPAVPPGASGQHVDDWRFYLFHFRNGSSSRETLIISRPSVFPGKWRSRTLKVSILTSLFLNWLPQRSLPRLRFGVYPPFWLDYFIHSFIDYFIDSVAREKWALDEYRSQTPIQIPHSLTGELGWLSYPTEFQVIYLEQENRTLGVYLTGWCESHSYRHAGFLTRTDSVHCHLSPQVTLVLQWHHTSSFSDGCMELTLSFLP